MKNIFLILCAFSFTACTTLNGAERCALIGQIHEGTQIGTQTNVSSVGDSVYSYQTEAHNPICKNPKTEEEKVAVSDLLPVAQEKQKKKNRETLMSYGGLILGLLVLGVIGATVGG